MALQLGIDTSILVRLVAREPQADYEECLRLLSDLVMAQGYEMLASNLVISEAYFALTHHYSISSADARAGIAAVLTSGLVAPLNGQAALDALDATGGAGLSDRLITTGYARAGMVTLTLDRQMGNLPNARRLRDGTNPNPNLDH